MRCCFGVEEMLSSEFSFVKISKDGNFTGDDCTLNDSTGANCGDTSVLVDSVLTLPDCNMAMRMWPSLELASVVVGAGAPLVHEAGVTGIVRSFGFFWPLPPFFCPFSE